VDFRTAKELIRDAGWTDDARTHVMAALWSLLPEPEAAAVIKRNGGDVLLAVSAQTLYEARVEGDEATTCTIEARRLSPEQAAVSVNQRIDKPSRGVDVRVRKWTFTFAPGEEVLALETEQIVRGSNGGEPPPNAELLARALARAVGWEVPTEDEGPRAN